MNAIFPADVDDDVPSSRDDAKIKPMMTPPARRITAPWADSVFALAARAAAVLTLSLLLGIIGSLFRTITVAW